MMSIYHLRDGAVDGTAASRCTNDVVVDTSAISPSPSPLNHRQFIMPQAQPQQHPQIAIQISQPHHDTTNALMPMISTDTNNSSRSLGTTSTTPPPSPSRAAKCRRRQQLPQNTHNASNCTAPTGNLFSPNGCSNDQQQHDQQRQLVPPLPPPPSPAAFLFSPQCLFNSPQPQPIFSNTTPPITPLQQVPHMVGSSPFGPFSTPIQPHADSGSTLLSSLPPPTPPPLYVQEHLAPPAYSYGAGTSILLNDGTPSSNTYNTDRGADVTSHSDGTPQGILTKTDTAAPLNPDNDYGPSPVRRLFIGSEEESQGDSSAEPIVDTNPISIPQPSSPTLNHVSAPQSCATRSTILYPVNLPTITIHSVPLSTTPKMSKPLPLLSGFQSVPRSETQDTCLTPMRMDVEMFRTKRKRAESPQTAPAPPTPQKMTPSMRRTPPPTAPPKIPSLENSGVRTCDFTTVCKLGAGSFGEVFEVESKKTRQRYALKIYRKTSKSSSGKEYYNTKNLGQHVNIVQIYELWEENFHTHILVQLCPNGSLKQRLSQHIDTHLDPDSQDYHLPQDTVLRWCSWIAQGLAHMHRHQIMHLDIKPENCLFDAQDILKIADLGNSSHVKDRDKSEGDSAYMDQQCLKENYGYFCDIFSLGIMMFEIVTHYILPRTGEAFHLLRDGKVMFPSHHNWPYTRELEQLIEGMMNPEFSARPTAVQLLQHRLLVPYVTDSRTAQLVHVTRHLEFSSQTPVAPTATTSTITQPTTPETPSHPATPQVLSPTPSPPQTPTHPSTSYPLPNHNL